MVRLSETRITRTPSGCYFPTIQVASFQSARIQTDAVGEIFISEDAVKSGNLNLEGLEPRSLELKGVVSLFR